MPGRLRVLVLVAVCVLAPRLAPTSTEGAFDARALNTADFSLAALAPPSTLTAAPVGLNVALAWTGGAGGNGTRLEAAGNGTHDDCSGAAFAVLASSAGTTYTDLAPSGAPGTRRCYRVRTAYASWTSVEGNPIAVVRLGVVATTVTLANAADTTGCSSSGQAGTLDCGDRITLTFNQSIDTATGPSASHTLCTEPVGGAVVLGAAAPSGACSAGETSSIGTLAGGAIGADARHAAAYAWSDGDRTLTVTVRERLEGTAAAVGGAAWTFTPTAAAGALLSSAGGHHVCTDDAGGADCLPETGSSV